MITPYDTTRGRLDLVAIDRYLTGTRPLPPLTDDEQRYAARVMADAGLSARTTGKRLGVAERTIVRWLAKEEATP